jgi:hypothetical protein
MTDRERLLLVKGVTDRVADMLEQAGYKGVEQVYAEQDVDRLAIRTGLDAVRAGALRDAVQQFVEAESHD